jgi:hypothetical protein
MANTMQTPAARADIENAGTYHALSNEKVAYSVSLPDLVIADYDASGAVRGLELVGKQIASLETFIELARAASRGPVHKTRGPIPEAAKGV